MADFPHQACRSHCLRDAGKYADEVLPLAAGNLGLTIELA
jgi:hypothetical protein